MDLRSVTYIKLYYSLTSFRRFSYRYLKIINKVDKVALLMTDPHLANSTTKVGTQQDQGT